MPALIFSTLSALSDDYLRFSFRHYSKTQCVIPSPFDYAQDKLRRGIHSKKAREAVPYFSVLVFVRDSLYIIARIFKLKVRIFFVHPNDE